MLITHKARFLVDCWEVSRPFGGSKVSCLSNFSNFLWSSFACKDNQNSLKKSPFSAILLHFVNWQWKEGIRMIVMLQICNLIKRYIFSAVFAIFLLVHFDSLFSIKILTFSFHFYSVPFPVVSRRFLWIIDKHIACPHELLCFFLPKTTMVVDQGCCSRSHLFLCCHHYWWLWLILHHFKTLSVALFPETKMRFLTFCTILINVITMAYKSTPK